MLAIHLLVRKAHLLHFMTKLFLFYLKTVIKSWSDQVQSFYMSATEKSSELETIILEQSQNQHYRLLRVSRALTESLWSSRLESCIQKRPPNDRGE